MTVCAHDAPPEIRAREGAGVHWTHAAVVALHSLCCGLPIVLALSGVAAGAGLLALHATLHAHEGWLLVLSGALVAIGAFGEARRRAHGRAINPLFYLSAACFVVNAALIAAHRLA